MYGSLITKELKKKHSPSLVGRVEAGSWDGEDPWQGSGWRTGWGRQQLAATHLHADKLGGTAGG